MKTVLIVNPIAGQGKPLKALPKVEIELKKEGFDLTVYQTRKPGEGISLAKEATEKGCKLLIVMGGDGTISEVVNGIADLEVPLAIIPTGTADVFAREMGIPSNPTLACRVIRQGKVRKIDLGKANSRYFVLMAGVGIDAQVVRELNPEVKRFLKDLAYPLTGVKTLLTYKHTLMRINLDKSRLEEGYFAVIGNARYYARWFSITSRASIEDGLLDVCIFRGGNIRSFVRYIQGVIRGTHLRYPDVTYSKARHVSIQATHPTLVQADGELVGKTPINFSIIPRALSVVVP